MLFSRKELRFETHCPSSSWPILRLSQRSRKASNSFLHGEFVPCWFNRKTTHASREHPMKSIFRPLLNLLAGSSDSTLRQQIQFLQVQDEILRSKLGSHVNVTPDERQRLVRFGEPLGSGVNVLLSIVTPRT